MSELTDSIDRTVRGLFVDASCLASTVRVGAPPARITLDDIVRLGRQMELRASDPDYDIEGPLLRWDLDVEMERHRLAAHRAARQTAAAAVSMEAEKRRARVPDDPTWILDEVSP